MREHDTIKLHFPRLKPPQASALAKMGLLTVGDLLRHFPTRYVGAQDTLVAKVVSQGTKKGWAKRVPMAEMVLENLAGNKIKAIWFAQAYMAKKFSEGALVRISGKAKEYRGTLSYTNPSIELASNTDVSAPGPLFESPSDISLSNPNLVPNTYQLTPIYPESRGVSSLWLTHAIAKILNSDILKNVVDPIPSEILNKYKLPSLHTALQFIHRPKKQSDAEVARKRFSFEEIFFIQLARQKERLAYKSEGAFAIPTQNKVLQEFTDSLPFKLTTTQNNIVGNILNDMSKSEPMTRLLEGDVGSGKTAVAAAAAYMTVHTRPPSAGDARQDFGNLQVAYMAPTEILAKQHFESFIEYFKHTGVGVGLVTGSECRKFPSKIATYKDGRPELSAHISRTKMLQHIKNGEITVVVGTHALIGKSIEFRHVGLAIIDEQHRFGTRQRAGLARLSNNPRTDSLRSSTPKLPHLLSMSATPIPRTLALTIYGDLDISVLDETPPGRKQVITKIVKKGEEAKVYDAIREQVKLGRQAYVICPRVNAPDPTKPARTYRGPFGTGGELALDTKSVTEEAKKLGELIFPELMVGMIHGKMSGNEKNEIMSEFANNEINVLVATSVIEVGVNVPNATIILIEGAERFGLAQLHQLRGRVLRSSYQAYCYLAVSAGSNENNARLKAIESAKNGFDLAEQDLRLRGPGSLVGIAQSGLSDVGMQALQNVKLVEAARTEARIILESDPSLSLPAHKHLASSLQSTLPHLE